MTDKLDGKLDSATSKLDAAFDRFESKMLTKWDVTLVVGIVIGAFMAAAMLGPQFINLLSGS